MDQQKPSRDRRRRIDALFADAFDLPRAQWDAYLTAHASDDPELRNAATELRLLTPEYASPEHQARHFGQMKQPLRAITLLERALKIHEQSLDPKNILLSDILIELGRERRQAGEPAAALEDLQRAQRLSELMLPPDHPGFALIFLEQARASGRPIRIL